MPYMYIEWRIENNPQEKDVPFSPAHFQVLNKLDSKPGTLFSDKTYS